MATVSWDDEQWKHELVTTACPRLRENDSSLTMLECVRVTPSLMQGSQRRPLTKPKHEPLPPACATTPICGDSSLFLFSHVKSFEMICISASTTRAVLTSRFRCPITAAWCWPRCTGSVSAILCESCLDTFLLRLCCGGSCMRHPC